MENVLLFNISMIISFLFGRFIGKQEAKFDFWGKLKKMKK